MALDNAQFISELSIVDPPGSDPLSQGDDHIRTTKRATQQSFPLIAAAVNITDVQMNDMAIKGEVNSFSPSQNFSNQMFIDASANDISTFLEFRDFIAVTKWRLVKNSLDTDNNLSIQRFVAGIFQDRPWEIDGTTGIVNFAQVPTVEGAPIWVAGELRMFVVNTAPGTNWFVADGLNGTVNLDNRVLVAEGLSPVGTNLAPNVVATAAGGVSGATTLSEAQMPSHTHDMKIADNGGVFELGKIASNQSPLGVNNGTLNKRFSNTAGGGERLIDDTGGSGSHTHTVPSAAVTENGATRDTVRPLSRTVQYHQYVP